MNPRSRSLWLALVVLAATSSTAGAGPAPAPDVLEPARKALVAKLEALATWCDGNRLAGERDRTFRRILLLDADHLRARGGLRYKRADKKSPWEQAADYVEPADWSKDVLPEAKKRRVEAVRAFREAATAAFDAAGLPQSDARREETVDLAIELAPDDDDFRESRGDVQEAGAWWLKETVDGRARRKSFSRTLRDLRSKVQIEDDPSALEDRWTSGAKSGRFSTWGSGVKSAECTAELRLRVVGEGFLEEVFAEGDAEEEKENEKGREREPRRVLLFPKYARARAYMESSPDYADALPNSQLLAGTFLAGGLYACWVEQPDLRLVTALSMLADWHLRASFRGKIRPWALEGLSQRICKHVAGRHSTAHCVIQDTDLPTDHDQDVATYLEDVTDWLPLAAEVLRRDPGRRVRAVLTMNMNAMRRGDVVTAYALAAYLLEGRPEGLHPLIASSAKLDDADAACKEALGVDAGVLARRVRRWVLETTAK